MGEGRWTWQPIGALALRLVVGLTFILHGWPKLVHSPEMVAFFARIGIPMPSLMVWVVGMLEVFGGLALAVGFMTRWMACLLALDMLVVILHVKLKQGVLGYNLELLLLASLVFFACSGPGRWAIQPSADTSEGMRSHRG
ncbi:MAG: DoxX family protein [Alicyclobacillus sp.]|nr:DoxX family protein [Alicyclobacillus sp.]